jgi:polysaccharide export outer membrane protein
MRLPLVALISLILCACSSLPHDGPSARMVQSAATQSHYALVDLDYRVTQEIAAHPAIALAGLAHSASTAAVDLIADGDTLSVSIYEADPNGIYGRPPAATDASGSQTFPRLVVDRDGLLSVPFAGDVPVAGLTARAAAQTIRLALRKKAVDPQVTVAVTDSRANSVSVVGEVRSAGHVPLSIHNDRVLDVIASAGGVTKPVADLEVVVVRGLDSAETPLEVLMRDSVQNVRLAPEDQVRLNLKPRKYSIFGAVGRSSQTAIEDDSLTLAGAIGRAGGLDNLSANASSVLVFRFERPAVTTALGVSTAASPRGVPVVYRLDLRRPNGYFVAGAFQVQADDLLYVPRADIAEARKFLDLVNVISQVAYDVRVTSVIP